MPEDKLKHRKASARIQILKKDGTPYPYAQVRAELVNHEFRFGCGGFPALTLFDSEGQPLGDDKTAFSLERLEKIYSLCNYATLPFYLGRYEPVEGKTNEKQTRSGAQWLADRKIRLKGHPLVWHTVCAPWLMEYSNAEIMEKLEGRIDRDVTAFRGLIDKWDVLNEAVIMPHFDKYDNAVTRVCKELGRVGLIKKVFGAAKRANPEAELLINDFNMSESYEILVDGCLNSGVPISAIGLQSHQHQGYWGKEKVLEVLDRYSRFGIPLHFTENTIISGELMPKEIEDLNDWQVESWPTTPEGEERQAVQTLEMLETVFENPLVEAFTTWDPADGAWLGAPSGLLRKDNSEKPVYAALAKKIKGDWCTKVDLVADASGWAILEGFKGIYELGLPGGKKAGIRLGVEEEALFEV
ncbi:MAG: endo-1,4-beta-xylanase [Clostridiales bacterium]|jgi:GH35 family endo-1,4-beta-xylanase|nr:endo-1,4-beta-xylanase [Clostridiales bacterium]